MKNLFLACCLFVFSLATSAQPAESDAAYRKQINAFIDEWHDDAANARLAYFDKIAPNGIYIGTDKTELWNREQFKAWAKRFFERKSAWSFKSVKRNVYMSPDKKFIWFDELLDTQMGPCQASGVMRKTAKGFEIEHYQLSIAIPNEVADQVTRLVKEADAKPVAKAEVKTAEVKAEVKPALKQDARPEARPAAKPDAKPDARTDSAPAAKLPARPVAN